jgi:antagonist of KipI
MASLTVIRPGMLTTIQDLGRWGQQGSGVPVAGPMDVYSHRIANRIVGNGEGAAALEITLLGPELESDADVVCAVAGARFALTVSGRMVSMHVPFVVPSGARLSFGDRTAGARATLAVSGGLRVPPVFGSRSTSLSSRMGPFGGRALVRGDILPVGGATHAVEPPAVVRALSMPCGGARLRVIPGPHDALFTRGALEVFFGSRFTVTPQSNRMGYRLEGRPLEHVGRADVLSDATPLGSIQVPASGLPILLMADRQTTGGYPKIATVITADMPLAGQLAPGDWVEFAACNRATALDALRQQDAQLTGLRS